MRTDLSLVRQIGPSIGISQDASCNGILNVSEQIWWGAVVVPNRHFHVQNLSLLIFNHEFALVWAIVVHRGMDDKSQTLDAIFAGGNGID